MRRTLRSMISLLLVSRSLLRASSGLTSDAGDSGGGGDPAFPLFDVSVAIE